ncbi:MAG: hypothetical protein RL095_1513 [Verrucomicrobiota bacterium]|jgi:carboxyl-terminal processing protease
MNRFLASLLAAFILPAGLARAEAEPDFDGAPGEAAKPGEPAEMATFDDMISVLDKGYYDVKYHGLDWKKEVEATRAAIRAGKTPSERYAAMQALIAKLGHSHINLSVPGMGGDKEAQPKVSPQSVIGFTPRDPGFSLGMVEGVWAVTSVTAGSPAAKAGLKHGFQVETIDGIKPQDLIPEGDKDGERRIEAYLHRWGNNTPELIGGGADAGTKLKFRLPVWRKGGESFGHVQDAAVYEDRILDSGVLYIHFGTWLPGMASKAVKAIQENRGRKGLIIDLRGNPGGLGMLACGLAKEICAEKISLGTSASRENTNTFPVIPARRTFNGPVVVLTDGGSASTSEIFAGGLQKAGRAKIVGTTTAGAVLASLITDLKGGARLQYPTSDYRLTDGTLIEGQGVKPDLEVKLSLAGLREKGDMQLAAAEELVLKEYEAKKAEILARNSAQEAKADETLKEAGARKAVTFGPGAEELYRKTLAAQGVDNLKDVKTVHTETAIEIVGQALTANSKSWLSGDRTLSHTEFGSMKMQNGYDGRQAWSKDPFHGLRTLEGAELNQALDGKLRGLSDPAYNYDSVELGKPEKFNDKEALVLIMKRAGEKDSKSFIDPKTFLPIGEDSWEVSPEGEEHAQTIIDEFTTHPSGVVYPSAIRMISVSSGSVMKARVTKMELNPELDEKIFDMPKN